MVSKLYLVKELGIARDHLDRVFPKDDLIQLALNNSGISEETSKKRKQYLQSGETFTRSVAAKSAMEKHLSQVNWEGVSAHETRVAELLAQELEDARIEGNHTRYDITLHIANSIRRIPSSADLYKHSLLKERDKRLARPSRIPRITTTTTAIGSSKTQLHFNFADLLKDIDDHHRELRTLKAIITRLRTVFIPGKTTFGGRGCVGITPFLLGDDPAYEPVRDTDYWPYEKVKPHDFDKYRYYLVAVLANASRGAQELKMFGTQCKEPYALDMIANYGASAYEPNNQFVIH
ncbi:hypothetical protein K490DRAFT_61895 [Saccharata proteae CBS 121410]|uniref:Uncharacterized protein n=1 Tax=Saccharata proteae CBS 121410 TaxID=1314787 RepID=A0A9P4HWN5_9PEZI|nr:hypothetical protein K490DRAFT_61895 [Saccharata proteae CBS 121410]